MNKGFANIVILIAVFILAAVAGYFVVTKKLMPAQPSPSTQSITTPPPATNEMSSPIISSISQSSGHEGDIITVHGAHFMGMVMSGSRKGEISTVQFLQNGKVIRSTPAISVSSDGTQLTFSYDAQHLIGPNGLPAGLYQLRISNHVGEKGADTDYVVSNTIDFTALLPTPSNATNNWQNYSNTKIGFSFKYPQTWKVEDSLGVNTCCLNVFNSMNPYQGDFLRQNVMKAQFQYHISDSISNKQQYIDSLISGSGEGGMVATINRSSIISIQNENGLDILKFNGGVGENGYIIPRKQNFSEILYVIVWNPDPTFEKVLSTFRLAN